MPEHTWTHEVANAYPQSKYTIEIQDQKGALLLQQTEGDTIGLPSLKFTSVRQPSYEIPEPGKRSIDDWIQLGKDDELNGRNLSALETYRKTLDRFPESFEAGKAAGRLALALLRFGEARALLEPLQARDTTDTEISYYLGIAYDGLGESDHARDAFEQAERLPSFYSASALALGELLGRKGDLQGAEQHLINATHSAPDDLRALEELVAVRNAIGQTQEAEAIARRALDRFPLSYFLREELREPDLGHLANDSDRILSIAAEYMRLGLYQKALAVLSRKYPLPAKDQVSRGRSRHKTTQ